MAQEAGQVFEIEKINLDGLKFSDFVDLIKNAISLLLRLETDYLMANRNLSFPARDIRRTTINKIYWLIYQTRHQYMVLDNYILKNKFWENVQPQDSANYDDVGALAMQNYRVNKIAFSILAFSSFEHYLRTIFEELWPEEYRKHQRSILGVCAAILPDKYASMDGDYFNLIKLLANQRNLVHNTGVYVATNKKYAHDEIFYKGKTYCYDHGKVAKHGEWEKLTSWHNDLLTYILEMNKHSTIRDIDFIEDISAPKDEN